MAKCRDLVILVAALCCPGAHLFARPAGAGTVHKMPAAKLETREQHDSYAIYFMLLRRWHLDVPSPILGIYDQTTTWRLGHAEGPCDGGPKPADGQESAYGPVIDDFMRRNGSPAKLGRRFGLPYYQLLTAREAQEIAGRHSVAPPLPPLAPQLEGIRMVFYLSAVWFSPDHKRALVYIATQYSGRHFFLVRTGGRWSVDGSFRRQSCH